MSQTDPDKRCPLYVDRAFHQRVAKAALEEGRTAKSFVQRHLGAHMDGTTCLKVGA